ncbi:MAG TPA: hypothetical protein PLQ31_12810 [Thermoanaerobaculia bacterium]|nr:hypothetical protein [Thermoanaerobaculia bacterium]
MKTRKPWKVRVRPYRDKFLVEIVKANGEVWAGPVEYNRASPAEAAAEAIAASVVQIHQE